MKYIKVGNQSSRTDRAYDSNRVPSVLITCELSPEFPTAYFSYGNLRHHHHVIGNIVRYLYTSCDYMRALALLEGIPLCFIVGMGFLSLLINVLRRLCRVSVMMAPVVCKSPEKPPTPLIPTQPPNPKPINCTCQCVKHVLYISGCTNVYYFLYMKLSKRFRNTSKSMPQLLLARRRMARGMYSHNIDLFYPEYTTFNTSRIAFKSPENSVINFTLQA